LRTMVTSPKKHPDNHLGPVPVSDNHPPPISTLDQNACEKSRWSFLDISNLVLYESTYVQS
jgi:hypothetical protein